MYSYTEVDQTIVDERVAEFRDQVTRRLSGELTEDEFRPLRLMNGLYLQRHAYMLRVAIPYGLLSATQVKLLGRIARVYDKGYGHITTRQNIQYNWPKLAEVPDLLAELAGAEMHAIQTSGNCVRNVTADHLSGLIAGEIEDPRPYCELLRQYSTFHPEFAYLPRKFKIAITGRCEGSGDGAVIAAHDIGLRIVKNDEGEIGFRVLVGGGLGRTPILGKVTREFLPKRDLCTYVEAVLRVYNLHGNRKNKYKARIKILVRSLGVEEFSSQVEREFARIKDGPGRLSEAEIARVVAAFPSPDYRQDAGVDQSHLSHAARNEGFAVWLKKNVSAHKVDGYNVVHISLKAAGVAPGDVTAAQLEQLGVLSESYSFGEVVTTHEQNMLLGHVENKDLYPLWESLAENGLATANIGTINDLICCPGLDFCSLANAGSIDISRQINDVFDDADYLYELGEIKLKMSGCINACGHHHVGHIGILGIDKRGEEWYQIMLGGSAEEDASLGRWLGPAIAKQEIAGSVKKLLDVYIELRHEDERFLETYRRLGVKPFSERIYGDHQKQSRRKRRVEDPKRTRASA